MSTIVSLLVAGLVLLAFEVIVPGGILGALGGLAMLGAVVMAFLDFGAGGGAIAFAVALALLALTLYVEFGLLPRTKVGQRLFLRSAVSGTSQPLPAQFDQIVGQEAEALTTLAPSGYVKVGGQRYEAFCRSGHAEKGTALRVVGVDNFRVIVSKPS